MDISCLRSWQPTADEYGLWLQLDQRMMISVPADMPREIYWAFSKSTTLGQKYDQPEFRVEIPPGKMMAR